VLFTISNSLYSTHPPKICVHSIANHFSASLSPHPFSWRFHKTTFGTPLLSLIVYAFEANRSSVLLLYRLSDLLMARYYCFYYLEELWYLH